jgi:hypothetical protein
MLFLMHQGLLAFVALTGPSLPACKSPKIRLYKAKNTTSQTNFARIVLEGEVYTIVKLIFSYSSLSIVWSLSSLSHQL